jgi:hypothetical protein
MLSRLMLVFLFWHISQVVRNHSVHHVVNLVSVVSLWLAFLESVAHLSIIYSQMQGRQSLWPSFFKLNVS